MAEGEAPVAYAIGAHPDDVEIYCLGLLLRLSDAGWRIGWAAATDGARGGDAARRREEATAAAATCGVVPQFFGLQDGALAADPRSQRAIADRLDACGADLVITHSPFDYHPDHRALARIVSEAASYSCCLLFCDGLFGLGPEPDFIVDIGPVAARKAAAFAMHTSQGASLAVEDLAAWARVRALQTLEPHVRLAEAFSAASRASLARAGVILASLNSCTDN